MREDGDAATVDIEIFPRLIENATIPLIMEGNRDAYSMMTTIAPDGASISSDGMTVSFNHSEDNDSVTLLLPPSTRPKYNGGAEKANRTFREVLPLL